jgi:hypothetical protein
MSTESDDSITVLPGVTMTEVTYAGTIRGDNQGLWCIACGPGSFSPEVQSKLTNGSGSLIKVDWFGDGDENPSRDRFPVLEPWESHGLLLIGPDGEELHRCGSFLQV